MTAHWPRRLALAFVLYGLVATAFLAINVPPFQVPDEPAHFMRAAQVAQGGLVGTRFTTTWDYRGQRDWAGAMLDPGLLRAWLRFGAVAQHPDIRVTRAMWGAPIHWSAERMMLPFSNTAINPPFLYVPAAIGVLVGRASRMTVPQTLVVSRLVTGVAAVAVGATAIAWAGGAAAWLFAVLTLPGSLALIASSSQDAMMLACSAAAGALLVRMLRWPSGRGDKVLVGLVAMLTLVATARLPYGMLALLPLGLTKLPLRSRVLAAGIIAVATLAWFGIVAATALTNVAAFLGADPTAQMAYLREHPLMVVNIAWATLTQGWRQYLETFVGRLGWGDTELPSAYRTAALAMLAIAALAAMLGLRGERISARARLVIAAGLLLAAGGVFGAEYLIWTVPGNPTVDEVEGRYFRPLALVGAALLPSPGAVLLPALGTTRWARLHDALVLAVAAFPLVSLAVLMRAVVLRFYLG